MLDQSATGMSETKSIMDGYSSVAGAAKLESGTSQGVVFTLMAVDASTTLCRLLVMFKLADRLKFVNGDFKPLLTYFFNKTAKIVSQNKKLRFDTDYLNEVGRRGKFDAYKVGTNFWAIMSIQTIIYLTSALVSLLSAVFRSSLTKYKYASAIARLHHKIHSVIFTIYSVDLVFYGIRSYLHLRNISDRNILSEHLLSYCLSRLVLVVMSVEYWALCSCILDDGMWRKYLRRQKLEDGMESYFAQVIEEYHAAKNVDQIKPEVDFPNSAGDRFRRLRMTRKLKECLAIMDDDSFTNSYRVGKMSQLSVAFNKQNAALRSGMSRFIITLDPWRHVVLSVLLVSGQSLPFLFSPLLLLYETVKLVLILLQFFKHRYFISLTVFFLEMSQSILMITELVTMCIVSLAPGNHFVLSMACIILIVSLIAIQVICTCYVFVYSATDQIKDILRQRRIRKLITMIDMHLEIKKDSLNSVVDSRLRRKPIDNSRQLVRNHYFRPRVFRVSPTETYSGNELIDRTGVELSNRFKFERSLGNINKQYAMRSNINSDKLKKIDKNSAKISLFDNPNSARANLSFMS